MRRWAGVAVVVLVTAGCASSGVSVGFGDPASVTATPVAPTPTLAPTPPPEPTATAVPTPTPPESAQTPAPPLVPPWLPRAEALISIFENSTTELQYGYANALGDGRGITAGRAGFTSGTGDLVLVVRRYVEQRPGSPLAGYLPALEDLAGRWSGELTGLDGFVEIWAEASGDPVMREVQDEVARELYFFPSQDLADAVGARLPLTRAVLYDTGIQHGIGEDPDGLPALIAEATERAGGTPADEIDERAWLDVFLTVRAEHLSHAFDPATREVWAQSVGRVDTLRDLLQRDLVMLDEPFTATAFGGVFEVP